MGNIWKDPDSYETGPIRTLLSISSGSKVRLHTWTYRYSNILLRWRPFPGQDKVRERLVSPDWHITIFCLVPSTPVWVKKDRNDGSYQDPNVIYELLTTGLTHLLI